MKFELDLPLLKRLLSVPSHYTDETRMVKFLKEYLQAAGLKHYTDSVGNVYVTKGSASAHFGYLPLICAHTDTVHPICDEIQIHERNGRLYGMRNGFITGCGGDDKAGIFTCLELLKYLDNVKAAFFVTEEIGCRGSEVADPTFFEDVGYAIEFDSPNHNIMSFSSNGFQLFDPSGTFAKVAVPILDSYGVTKWQRHPYTDVSMLRKRFEIECLNLPCGYYNMHTEHEYVSLVPLKQAICYGAELLWNIPRQSYMLEARFTAAPKERNITELIVD